MGDRRSQMKWLLFLTAASMVPVYILLGWQSGGHSPVDVAMWFWYIESVAWGIRALVEAWALVYLFNTVTNDKTATKVLVAFEAALIGLIALTVGLSIVANGGSKPVSELAQWLFWLWAFSVAAFAPLMMGGVGYAYKAHFSNNATATLQQGDNNLLLFADMVANQPQMTVKQLAQEFSVSEGTIRNWKRKLQNGPGS